jgi:hypothetical protein
MVDTNKVINHAKKVGLVLLGKILTDQIMKGKESPMVSGLKFGTGLAGAIFIPDVNAKSFFVGVSLDGAEDAYVVYNKSKSGSSGGLA